MYGVDLAAASFGLQYLRLIESDYAPQISNNYGISALGMVISFATVFRTNWVWQRYWEALAQVHVMYSKLTDAFSQFCASTESATNATAKTGNAAKVAELTALANTMRKHVSA